MTLTYQEVARILTIIDAAPEVDLDLTLDRIRITVTCWRQKAQSVGSSVECDQVDLISTSDGTGVSSSLHEISTKRLGYFCVVPGVHVGTYVRAQDPIGTISGFDSSDEVVAASQDGQIVDICIDDGDFVEYGQTLAILQPIGDENTDSVKSVF